jgi:serine/threonine protein phosphatase PrpC
MLGTPAPDLVAAVLTDRGRQRDSNEDAYALRPERGLLLVSDGIGGHRAGATASAAVAAVLPGLVEARTRDISVSDAGRTSELLRDSVVELSQELRRQSASDPEIAGLGATLALLLFRGEAAWVVHMGDSRVYRFRAGSLEGLTQDHSLAALLVRRGEMSAGEAEQHPELARLTRYVGMEGVVYPDVRPESPQSGDRYLLCTDGLTAMLGDDELKALLRTAAEPEGACRALVEAANAAGGRDNVTVVVGDWRCPAK